MVGRFFRGRADIGGRVAVALLVAACVGAPLSPTPSTRTPASAGSPQGSSAPQVSPTAGSGGSPIPTSSAQPSVGPVATLDPSIPWVPTTARALDEGHVTCDGSIGATDPVAIVQLAADGDTNGPIVLRDYADVAHPRTVCEGLSWWDLLDAHHLRSSANCVAANDCTFAVIDLPDATVHWYAYPFDGPIVALAADLKTLAWRQYDEAGGRIVHVADGSGDYPVATFPTPEGRCGTYLDSNIAAFSRSGDFLYVLDQPFPEYNALVVVGGHDVLLSIAPPDGGWNDEAWPLMAIWSPISDTLYYRRGSDVFRWTPTAGVKRILRDVPWLHPTITPDGRHLAYEIRRDDGSSDVYLAPIADPGSAVRIARDRANPVFLNDRQLWYMTLGDGCGGPLVPKPRVYDLVTGTEYASIVEGVTSIWPGTSSNH